MDNDDGMTIDEFVEKYKAIENPFGGGYIFGDSAEEWEFITKQNPDNVWTWTSVNDAYGTEELYGGIHKVNNVGQYFVTEIPSTGWYDFVKVKYDYIRVIQGSSEMGMDEFTEEYKLRINHIYPENGVLFKETDEEFEFVRGHDNLHVWTYYETSADCDYTGLVINGLLPPDEPQPDNVEWIFKGYFVAEKPAEYEDDSINIY